ncbi:MAG: protein-L-isoaspartate(D-aspartate) O-methyltransferase [Thermovirgaceae bacterium]
MRDWRQRAKHMVETQLVPRGVRREEVLRACMDVPRHLFVRTQDESFAYEDYPLPIGYGQTISQPYMVGRMTELLDVSPGLKVLEVGTGSGYQAAILAELGADVYTVERIPALARQAQKNLRSAGYDVVVRFSDGCGGLREFAPYDRVLVTAAADRVHPEWEEQLAEGGKILVPIRVSFGTERLLLRAKKSTGFEDAWYDYCRFVPLLSGLEGEDDNGDGRGRTENFSEDGE